MDGVNHTCDDLHAWLTPFTGGQNHFIYVNFDEVIAEFSWNNPCINLVSDLDHSNQYDSIVELQ